MASTYPSPAATRLVPPPIDAPTSTGRLPPSAVDDGRRDRRPWRPGCSRRPAPSPSRRGPGRRRRRRGSRPRRASAPVPFQAWRVCPPPCCRMHERAGRIAPGVAGQVHPAADGPVVHRLSASPASGSPRSPLHPAVVGPQRSSTDGQHRTRHPRPLLTLLAPARGTKSPKNLDRGPERGIATGLVGFQPLHREEHR